MINKRNKFTCCVSILSTDLIFGIWKLLTVDIFGFFWTLIRNTIDHTYNGIQYVYRTLVFVWEYIFGKKERFEHFTQNENFSENFREIPPYDPKTGVVGFCKYIIDLVVNHSY
jgi:hypothetical protein